MLTGHIEGANRVLGAPKTWNQDEHGHCSSLPVRIENTSAGVAMTSAWIPTAEEIEAIRAGAPIYLTILGLVHPPVAMSVGEAPI